MFLGSLCQDEDLNPRATITHASTNLTSPPNVSELPLRRRSTQETEYLASPMDSTVHHQSLSRALSFNPQDGNDPYSMTSSSFHQPVSDNPSYNFVHATSPRTPEGLVRRETDSLSPEPLRLNTSSTRLATPQQTNAQHQQPDPSSSSQSPQ